MYQLRSLLVRAASVLSRLESRSSQVLYYDTGKKNERQKRTETCASCITYEGMNAKVNETFYVLLFTAKNAQWKTKYDRNRLNAKID